MSPIFHIIVKSDEHGNPPSKSEVQNVARKFRKALADASVDKPGVFVTTDRVKIEVFES